MRVGSVRLWSAAAMALSWGLAGDLPGDVVDLLQTIDQVEVKNSPLLRTWLRDPLDREWEKTRREDGGETWSIEIGFPVHPQSTKYLVSYQGQDLPAKDTSDDSIHDVGYTLFIPEAENLGCREVFRREGSITRKVGFRATDRVFFRLRARGSHAQGVYPVARLSLGSTPLLDWPVNAWTWRIYMGAFASPKKESELRLSFVNDGTNTRNGEDRNLYVDGAELLHPAVLSVHFPGGAAPAYAGDAFEFRCAPDLEALIPALIEDSFLSPFLVEGETRPARGLLQDVEVGRISRHCLRLGAPSELEWPLTVGPGKNQLRFAVASDDYGDSGCTLRLSIPDGETDFLLWERFLPPAHDRTERAWREEQADLTPWQGRRITLRLTVDSGMPLHGSFGRDKSEERSAGVLFANPRLLTGDQPPQRNNVIMICLDTLRADHLSCYGYERNTSPVLDEFAGESVRFEYCVSASNSTLPAHGSLFTSLLSHEHGAIHLLTRLRDGAVTMSELLRKAGYRTVAFVDGGFLAPFYGFCRGFDLYDSRNGRAANVFPRAIGWLQEEGGFGPFFMFVHVYDPHTPYNGEAKNGGYRNLFDPQPGYSRISEMVDQVPTETLFRIERGELRVNRNDVEHIMALYDAGIRLLDDRLRDLFGFLEAGGFLENSLIVVMSDHGEHFGERDFWIHGGPSLFRELLHVPLLMRFPSRKHAGLVIQEPVTLMDLMPTFAEYAGVSVPAQCRGRSLLPLLEGGGEGEARDLLSESVAGGTMAVTSREEKGIMNCRGEPVVTDLFDMRYDRHERVNLVAREPEAALRIKARLTPLLGAGVTIQEREVLRRALDEELAAQMEALGYLAK